MAVASAQDVPSRLGRYEVRGKIGEGGMATVYLGFARDPSLPGGGLLVALKVIKELYALNTEFVTMFSDEAKTVSRFNHPNIVRVFELGAEGNRLFMAMEFLNGQSLWHVWNACRERGVRLRYDVAAWIGARAAEGLHHAHELHDERGEFLNIVHRDVNASNIFITYDGQVKIIDFGLAKAANRISRTRAGMVKGKLAYMSPEQVVGKPLDRRTDIFALGTTLWEVTADRRLFKGETDFETMDRVHLAEVPNPLDLVDGYPEPLWEVLQKMLQKSPQNRYRDALEVASALDRAALYEGRTVNESVVSGIMHALFAAERAQHEQWIAEASKTVAMGLEMRGTMRPGGPGDDLAVEGEHRPSHPGGAAGGVDLVRVGSLPPIVALSASDFAPASTGKLPAPTGSEPPASFPDSRTPAMPGRAVDAGRPATRSMAPSVPSSPPAPGKVAKPSGNRSIATALLIFFGIVAVGLSIIGALRFMRH
ncbi:MAG: serine/threonine-protein kinase [Polyangiaceae bacterium]